MELGKMDKKQLVEHWNKDIVKKLICSDDLSNDTVASLKKIKNRIKNGKIFQKYKFASYSKGTGRLFPEPYHNLTTIDSRVRRLIVNETCHDIDIENCHYVILQNICNKYNLKCDGISTYIKNRDEIISTFMNKHSVDRADIKKDFIQILNGGNTYFLSKDESIVSSIINDRQSILDSFKVNLNFDFILKVNDFICKKEHIQDQDKIDRKFFSRVLFTYENKCLQCMYDVCTEYNVEITSLIYDGMLVKKSTNFEIGSLIEKMKTSIKKILGFDINIVEKSMEIKDSDKILLDNIIEEETSLTSNQIAQLFFDKWKFRFRRKDNILYLIVDDVWVKILDKNCKKFDHFVTMCYYKLDFEFKNSSSLVRKMLYSMLISELDNSISFETILDHAVGYLPFNDGVYEFETKKLLTFEEATNMNIYFSKKLNYNYPKTVETKNYKKVYDNLFGKIFNYNTELINANLNFFSRRLAGHNEKHFIAAQGDRDSGKSVIILGLQNAFGGFVDVVDGNQLCVSKAFETAERSNSFLSKFVENRLIFVSEFEDNRVIDSKKIKQACSGGEKVNWRHAHGVREEGYTQAGFCVFGNNIGKASSGEVWDEVLYFDFPCIFKEKGYQDINCTKVIYEKDESIKSWLLKTEQKECLTRIILDAYSKEQNYNILQENAKEFIEEGIDSNNITNFKDLLQFGEDYFITYKDMNNLVKYNKININTQKRNQLLIKWGCKLRHSKIVNGKSIKVINGCKKMTDDEDEDELE
jgi:hypothetical protein